MMFAEELDFSSENETEDNNYVPSDGNGEIDENVPAFDFSDEEAKDCRKITEQILGWHENSHIVFSIEEKNWKSDV